MLLRKINTALPVRQGGLWDVYPDADLKIMLAEASESPPELLEN